MRSKLLGVALACGVAWVEPTRARAGNDDELLLGDQAAMTGGAVTAPAADGGAIYYNPAGIMNVDHDTIDLTGTLYQLRIYSIPRFLESSGGVHDDADVIEALAVPTTVSYIRPVNDRWRLALGVFKNRSRDASLQSFIAFPSPGGDDTSWQVALGLYRAEYTGGASVGWRPHPKVRVGASMFVVYNSDFNSATYAGGVYDPTLIGTGTSNAIASAQESALVSLQRWGFRWNAGVQVDVTDRLILGASVMTPTYVFKLNTTITSAVSLNLPNPDPTMPNVYTYDPNSVERVDRGWEPLEPWRMRVGAAYDVGRGYVSADFDYQPALINAALEVDRIAVWNLRVGTQLEVAQFMFVGAGFFTDRSSKARVPPISDEFGAAEQQFYGGTVGFRYDTRRALAEGEEDDAVFFSTTIAVRYAYGSGYVTGLRVNENLDASPGVVTFPRRPYTTHELGIHLGGAVLF